eukprot:snap_masked-scaffold_4-processed-gene-7.46-mRNA-1 protein AED:0.31 eAED:0.33 QI:0/-1/0/1/-1/1/1/0/380
MKAGKLVGRIESNPMREVEEIEVVSIQQKNTTSLPRMLIIFLLGVAVSSVAYFFYFNADDDDAETHTGTTAEESLFVSVTKFDPLDSQSHDLLTFKTPLGASISLTLFGATIVSIKNSDQNEKLYLSPLTSKSGTSPIRGGIPVIFPKFGSGLIPTDLPGHGFARRVMWHLNSAVVNDKTEALELSLYLNSTMLAEQFPNYSEAWPYSFSLILEASLSFNGQVFQNSLTVNNDGTEDFEFQALLHTYYLVDDIADVSITGLDESTYIDKVDDWTVKKMNGTLYIEEEVDYIYSPELLDKDVLVQLGGSEAVVTVSVEKEGKAVAGDVVVWNPWAERSLRTSDLAANSYLNFVAVEPGFVEENAILGAGRAFQLIQEISFA